MSSLNGMKSLPWRICSRCLIRLLQHVVKFIDFVFRRMSGLFQIGTSLQGMSGDLFVPRNSQQASKGGANANTLEAAMLSDNWTNKRQI